MRRSGAERDRAALMQLDAPLRSRVESLLDEGQAVWNQFDTEVRQKDWHPFVKADYNLVLQGLVAARAEGVRFLEWGSATGIITILADLLGFEAYGIEIDQQLVATARELADRFGSRARFANGSFLPTGYVYRSDTGDNRLGTIADDGPSAYLELGHPLEDFDLVFAYPWPGEDPIMIDLMKRYGGRDARLLLYAGSGTLQTYRAGRLESERE